VGYSTNKTVSNDGIAFVDENGLEYDPYSGFQSEQSCEDTLSNLCTISQGKFDFAVVDGNHEGSHLRRETAMVRRLLRPEGILILDDVSDAWTEIKAEYDDLRSKGWRAVTADGRVGVLQTGST
jgi:Methyltransferase domain